MRVAAFIFYALAVLSAAVGIYSASAIRDEIGRSLTGIIVLFAGATFVLVLMGVGLQAMAREREDE